MLIFRDLGWMTILISQLSYVKRSHLLPHHKKPTILNSQCSKGSIELRFSKFPHNMSQWKRKHAENQYARNTTCWNSNRAMHLAWHISKWRIILSSIPQCIDIHCYFKSLSQATYMLSTLNSNSDKVWLWCPGYHQPYKISLIILCFIP